MIKLLFLAISLLMVNVCAQEGGTLPPPKTTTFTRSWLLSTNAAQASALLGASGLAAPQYFTNVSTPALSAGMIVVLGTTNITNSLPTGVPIGGQKITYLLFSTNAQAVTWPTNYTDLVVKPSVTVAAHYTYVSFIYNSYRSGILGYASWDCVGVRQE